MVRFSVREILIAFAVASVLLCVATIHGRFGFVLFLVGIPLAVAATIVTRTIFNLNLLVGLAVTLLFTGLGVLLVHGQLAGTVHEQPGRLMGAIVIGATSWWYTLHLSARGTR